MPKTRNPDLLQAVELNSREVGSMLARMKLREESIELSCLSPLLYLPVKVLIVIGGRINLYLLHHFLLPKIKGHGRVCDLTGP